MIETDVRLTKDGHLLTCHDENFYRLTKIDMKVLECPFEELPSFSDTIPLHFSQDKHYRRSADDDNSYTLLEDVFKQIPNEVVMHIDMKDKQNPAAAKELVRLIHKYERQSTTIVGAERLAEVELLHELDPSIPKIMPAETIIKLVGAYYLGLLPFIRL